MVEVVDVIWCMVAMPVCVFVCVCVCVCVCEGLKDLPSEAEVEAQTRIYDEFTNLCLSKWRNLIRQRI